MDERARSCILVLLTSICFFAVVVDSRLHMYGRGWQAATATWYGRPDGAGTDGGACGYGDLPSTPYGLDVGAGSPVLFRNGRGCGECYKLKCTDANLCSGRPVTVVITDECPGGYCAFGRTHFDLSGTAFGKMAVLGQTPRLLASGVLQVLYKRVDCDYGRGMEFEINQGSTPFWFSVLVRYEDGPGDLGLVEVKQSRSRKWQAMNQVWGANWCLNSGSALQAPFSLRIRSLSTNQTVVAWNVIPKNWAPGVRYRSTVNFDTRRARRQ